MDLPWHQLSRNWYHICFLCYSRWFVVNMNDFCLQCFDAVGWVAGRHMAFKNLSGEVLAWLSVWSEVRMICIWSSWCHCHPIVSCCSKIQNGLHFWCRPTQVVLEKRPLNGCSVVVVNTNDFWLSYIVQDCEEAIVTLISGGEWDEALRLVNCCVVGSC